MGKFRAALEAEMARERVPYYHSGPPALSDQITAAEMELGSSIPEPLQDLYREFDGLWIAGRKPGPPPMSLDDYLVLPLARLRAAHDRLIKVYTRNEGEACIEQIGRCVAFYTPESGASFLFITDQAAWDVPSGHIGKFDHDGGVSDLWDSLEEWLRHLGRPWSQGGADMES